jgi:hypothetical protein
LISVSVAPMSYFFWAEAGKTDNAIASAEAAAKRSVLPFIGLLIMMLPHA